ncbi:hypothetical protein FO519_003914 [Halicephalobus sp. NKZ332]|nr:hypothetical protein FO519_003914 [Halicephalobus sp. NKZ332]
MEAITGFYSTIHPPLALSLCISGAIGHILAIYILTQMMNPTNLLLVSMSCSQLALCANFLYSTLFKYGSDQLCLSTLWTFGWTSSLLVSVNLAVIVEMCGVFHVVAISIVRYVSLEKLAKSRSSQPWFDYPRCWRALIIIYGSVLFVCGPLYFHSEVREAVEHEYCIERFPELKGRVNYRLSFADNRILNLVNFWLFGSICKIIPCSILCIMSVLLVGSLSRIREMSARFANVERDRQHYRTTKIILIIMSIFICVEFPQGILAVAQSLTTLPYQDFLGDLFEMLTLLASCLIFALFCSMNSRLRRAFFDNARKTTLGKQDFLEVSSIRETKNLVEWGTPNAVDV